MKKIIFILMLALVALYGCTSSPITFEQGVKKINKLDKQYDADIKTPPNSTENINGLLGQLVGFKALNENIPQSLEYLLDFKIKTLEAEKLHIEGWQWGKGSTTDYGFGCRKGYARIINSSKIRNASAQKGYEAINSLQMLIDEFPDKTKSLNLLQKDILFLNAAYFQIENKAAKDARLITSACKKDE
ncbi:hypothetical protein CL615_03600 [archaeon]|nr:hypothetical protein [archaeon]